MGGVRTYLEALMTLDEAPLKLEPGQVIFSAGEAGQAMFIVRTGSVDLRIGETVLETVEQGGIFGELALVDPAPRTPLHAETTRRADLGAGGGEDVVPPHRADGALDVPQTQLADEGPGLVVGPAPGVARRIVAQKATSRFLYGAL